MNIAGGGGGLSVMLLALVLCAQMACGTTLAYSWPRTKHRQVIEVESPVVVRGDFPGAVVKNAAGDTVLGPAPAEIAATYQVEKRWEERRIAGAAIGGGLGFASFGVGFAMGMINLSEEASSVPWFILAGVGFVDAMAAMLAIPSSFHYNAKQRNNPERNIVSVEHEYRVVWDGFDPVTVTVTAPETEAVVAARPTEVTFEQALLYWTRHQRPPGEEPASDGSPAGPEPGALRRPTADAPAPGIAGQTP